MGRDESGTLARLREHRKECLEPALARYVPSQSRFHFLLRSLVLRLGTMTHLLRFFQLPD